MPSQGWCNLVFDAPLVFDVNGISFLGPCHDICIFLILKDSVFAFNKGFIQINDS